MNVFETKQALHALCEGHPWDDLNKEDYSKLLEGLDSAKTAVQVTAYVSKWCLCL